MDEDKKENIEEARIASMLDSEGWKLAKEKLMDYIETLESIKTLPNGTNDEVGEEAKVRARVVSTLLIWLNDLESVKEAKLQDVPTMQNDYIRFYGE